MKIRVNGKDIDFRGFTIEGLLTELKLQERNIAVEMNGALVHRDRYADETLHDGDTIEIVHFVGGG